MNDRSWHECGEKCDKIEGQSEVANAEAQRTFESRLLFTWHCLSNLGPSEPCARSNLSRSLVMFSASKEDRLNAWLSPECLVELREFCLGSIAYTQCERRDDNSDHLQVKLWYIH